jgi:outer membrane protein, multidrug efflux system
MRVLRTIRCLPLTLVLASCAVGPNFSPPSSPVPPRFVESPKDAPSPGPAVVSSESAPEQTWWHAFHDPQLDQLEERTQKGNLDLQAGLLRIVEARTQVQVARSQGLPSLNATASYNREQLGAAGILKAQGSSFGGATLNPALVSALTKPINLYQVGFDASWELDLFGKVSRSVEAARAQSDEAVESRNDMLVSLEAEVAQTYLQLRAAQLLRSITLGLISAEREVLELTISRQTNGLAQQGDVESARAQVSSLQSDLPQYEQSIAVSRHALAVLIGQPPETLDSELGSSADLPALPQLVPIGLPSALARRRPDIRQAEATLHAATAEIGVSVASLYPDISLAGSFGLRNTSTHYLFDWASKFYSAGPTISLPIFRGGALVANVKMARAEAAAAALNYRKAVLTALREVEDGLVSLDQDSVRVAALKDTVAADQRALDITTHAYKVGLTTYISVLNLELQTNQAKLQLAQASLTEITDLVKLYKALGGGWEAEPGPGSASN